MLFLHGSIVHSVAALIPMTPWEALAKFFHNGWTVEGYIRNYKESKARNAPIWPPYEQLRGIKKQCIPRGILLQDDEVICPLQSYVDEQAKWLLDDPYLMAEVQDYARDPNTTIKLYFTFGLDGSGGHPVYRWGTYCRSLLATSIAPIELQAIKGSDKAVLWTNPRANSPTANAYLRLKFEPELKG